MIARPISILAPQIHLLCAGMLPSLYRPARGQLARLAPGDVLWVREPFHLPRQFDHVAPSQAASYDARPIFRAHPGGQPLMAPDLPAVGRPRFARELLRAWHRQHLVVSDVHRRSLRSLTDAEIARQGFALRDAFAETWDRNLSLSAAGQTWNDDPEILVIEFTRIAAPFAPEMEQAT